MTKLTPETIDKITDNMTNPNLLISIWQVADADLGPKILDLFKFRAQEQRNTCSKLMAQITGLHPEDTKAILDDEEAFLALSELSSTTLIHPAICTSEVLIRKQNALQELTKRLLNLFS